MIFFIFVLESVYFIRCCSITNTVISLLAHETTLNSYEQPVEILDSIK